MTTAEKQMLNALVDLKENHNIAGVKISYEDEGLTGDMAQIINAIALKAGVPVSVKIGGCEARRDMYDAKLLGASKVVAPMVETAYAMKKFVEAAHSVYTDEEYSDTKFMVNIETITGYKNLPQMVATEEFKEINGIVLGRVDFSGSMGRDRGFVNSEEMQKIAIDMANIAQAHGKKFLIGGGVSADSLAFFRKLPAVAFSSFETRNIIFDASYALQDKNISHALIKAMGFELAWMRRKNEFYGHLSNAEIRRIAMIEERYKHSLANLERNK